MHIRSRTTRELRAADELAAAGKTLEAIDVLTHANRQRRNARIERRLVQLRFQAPLRPERANGIDAWPPAVSDLFSTATGIPEIDAAKLTPETLSSGIFHHGCLLVRGLIGPDRVGQLVTDIDRTFEAHDAALQATAHAKPPWFVPFDAGEARNGHLQREFVRGGGGVLAVDSPPTLFDVIEAFEEVGIRDLAGGYFGEDPMLLAAKWTLRLIRPEEFDLEHGEQLDFHQDGSFMGENIRSLDLWLSLSHCGVDAPGLDIAARRFDRVVKTGAEGAVFGWTVAPDTARRVSDGAIVTPVFAPGDALLFDHLLLHRTSVRPHMTRNRHAIEAWFAAPSAYPDTQVPIAY